MRVYIAHAVTNKNAAGRPLETLVAWLSSEGHTLTEPKPHLHPGSWAHEAIKGIDTCELLLADVSTYSHGVGFEIGYAYAKRKRLMITAFKSARISLFLQSLFPELCVYSTAEELVEYLRAKM